MSEKQVSEKLGPAFNRLFSASVISNLSDGLLAVAAPLLAISLTKDPILISMLSIKHAESYAHIGKNQYRIEF
jgi:hypothetical protein